MRDYHLTAYLAYDWIYQVNSDPLQAEQIKEIGTYLRQKREEGLLRHGQYRRPDDDQIANARSVGNGELGEITRINLCQGIYQTLR
ncbi:MAG UNVERIFIED_CONTAM: hypothetical protein LVR29_13830 [Microcystis novacekii LVE1205-3]